MPKYWPRFLGHFLFLFFIFGSCILFPKDLAKSGQVVFELNVKLPIQEFIICFFGPTHFFFPTALLFSSVNTGCAPQVSHPKEVANTVFLI